MPVICCCSKDIIIRPTSIQYYDNFLRLLVNTKGSRRDNKQVFRKQYLELHFAGNLLKTK